MTNKLADNLSRDLFIFYDERNPQTSTISRIYGSTILDQVFDPLTPTKKTLREILEEIRVEIRTGGQPPIVFPVTSVNNYNGDVVIRPIDLGLDKVDNTRDIDKPLSNPQLDSIMTILQNYRFSVNLTRFDDHLVNTNNPHNIRVEHLDVDNELTNHIDRNVSAWLFDHNRSSAVSTHRDIRRMIWAESDRISEFKVDTDTKFRELDEDIEALNIASQDHRELLDQKESKSNKVNVFSDTVNNSSTLYPSTAAILSMLQNKLDNLDVRNYQVVSTIKVVSDVSMLPIANESLHRAIYLIRHTDESKMAIAVCEKNDDEYYWDIVSSGAISTLDSRFFVNTTQGMTLNLQALYDALINDGFDPTLPPFVAVRTLEILPGTMDGFIRYYINDDMSTMKEIRVSGLKSMAFQEWLIDYNIPNKLITERHIGNLAITNRMLTPRVVNPNNMYCTIDKVLGNFRNSNNSAHEITIAELGDAIQNYFGGAGNPNNPILNSGDEMILSPHLWDPATIYNLQDQSYGIRFKGTISVLPNTEITLTLTDSIKMNEFQLVDAGGSWYYSTNPNAQAILGGSNITGFTFATVLLDEEGLHFTSISTGDRMNADYDIWIRYIRSDLVP